MWRILAFLFFTLVLPATASGSTAKLIHFLNGELKEIRQTIEQRDSAPLDPGLFETGAPKYQEDLNALLDEALSIVVPNTHRRWSEVISKVEDSISEAEDYRDELKLKRFGAEKSKGVGMLDRLMGRDHEQGSIEDLNIRLNEVEATIEQLKKDRESAEFDFASDMRELHGIDLSTGQAKALLYSVNGSLIVEAKAVLQALAEVERQMAEVLRENNSPDARSTYTGIASITRLIHVRMLQRHLDAYNGRWLPKLSNLRAVTEALLADTRRKAAKSTDGNAIATFKNNIIVQERIIDVIRRYEGILKKRRGLTERARKRAEERARAAVNTLKTLETAAAVSYVFQESDSEFKAIFDIELPMFENLDPEEVEEFLDISRSLGS